jgi:hypothetical protein
VVSTEGEDDVDSEVVLGTGVTFASTMVVGACEEVDWSMGLDEDSDPEVCVGEELISLGADWLAVASEGEDDAEVVGTVTGGVTFASAMVVGVYEEVDWSTAGVDSEVYVGEGLIPSGGDWLAVSNEGEDTAEVVGTGVTFASTVAWACGDMDGLADPGGRGVTTLLSMKMSV